MLTNLNNERVKLAMTDYSLFTVMAGHEALTKRFSGPVWLVSNLIEDASANLLVGAPGSYKSFFCQTLALSLATGRDFLGHFPVTKPRHVMYIQTESGERGLLERLKKLAAGMDIEPDETKGTLSLVTNQPFRLDNKTHVDWVAQRQPDLVIIDALRDFHDQDENSSIAMKPIADSLRWLRDQHNVSSLTLHHTNKAPEYAKGRDKTRGTTALWAAMDGRFYVSESDSSGWVTMQEPYLKEHGIQPSFKYRAVIDDEQARIEWQPIGGLMLVAASVDHPASHLSPIFRPAVEGKILAAFMAAEQSTNITLANATGFSVSTIRRVMQRLQAGGWAVAISSNSKGGRNKAKVFAPTTLGRKQWDVAA